MVIIISAFRVPIFQQQCMLLSLENDECHQLFHLRSDDQNNISSNASPFASRVTDYFYVCSFQLAVDNGESCTNTPWKNYFISSTYKPITGLTISGIASGIDSSVIGSVLCEIKDDDANVVDLQIYRALHLETLPSRLISPKQTLKKSNNFHDGFHMWFFIFVTSRMKRDHLIWSSYFIANDTNIIRNRNLMQFFLQQ